MNFNDRITEALGNQSLRTNLRGAMDFLRSKRLLSIEKPDLWEAKRKQAGHLRQDVTRNLASLLERLEDNCTRNGMQVHWAENADQANQLILDICKQKAAESMVKGKSMASEEIELNDYLARHQIECIESDMGEFIVQLAEEKPSHIIMPALHKSQQDIASLFQAKLQEPADPDDVDQLIDIGRKTMREKFKHADIGLSGVNFAIADKGLLCLVENEGNGRMSTTVPDTHIAIMGLEKVLPDLNELPTLLHLLTRSATGQRITTYLNLISGPRRNDERDGPREVHLVLLDNGRSQMAADEALRSSLACIRCGACMNHCPVYTRIGGHAYGSTYPGPIGQVIAPQLNGEEKYSELSSACSMNNACGDVCPVGIDLPGLIRTQRSRHAQRSFKSKLEAGIWYLWQWLHLHPTLYRLARQAMSRRLIARLLIPGSWRSGRGVPVSARLSLHQIMAKRKQSSE
ncbi:MAG: iron-sulfur cluster-binding protein [Oleiphilus sp.]|nr:MAG: iron-sulfur cluster-binding protein [Oleiphilus sp.]